MLLVLDDHLRIHEGLDVELDDVPPGGLLLHGNVEVDHRVLPHDLAEAPDHLLQKVLVGIQGVPPHVGDHEGSELVLDGPLRKTRVCCPVPHLDPISPHLGKVPAGGVVEADLKEPGTFGGAGLESDVDHGLVHHLGCCLDGPDEVRDELVLSRLLDHGLQALCGLQFLLGFHVDRGLGAVADLLDDLGHAGPGEMVGLDELEHLVLEDLEGLPEVRVAGPRGFCPPIVDLDTIVRGHDEVEEQHHLVRDVP